MTRITGHVKSKALALFNNAVKLKSKLGFAFHARKVSPFTSSTPLQHHFPSFNQAQKKPIQLRSIQPIVPCRQSIIAQQQPLKSQANTPLYENKQARLSISRERVTQQFAQPELTSSTINKEAWSLFHQGNASPWGKNTALLHKAGQLGQVSSTINQHNHDLKQPLGRNDNDIEKQGRRIIDNLQKGMNEIAHLMQQQNPVMSTNEHNYLSDLHKTLHNEQKLMLQVMEDPKASSFHGDITLKEAAELKRLGYDLNPELAKHFSLLSDSHYIKGSEVHFGSGAIHSVTKLKYATSSGSVEKVFKGEDAIDPCPFDSVSGKENYLNTSKPGFAARNFAAAKFDNLLATHLMPTMELTVHNGQMGVLMDVAKGIKPLDQRTNTYTRIPVEDNTRPKVAATIQEQLNSAEWLDGICGQQDRHAGNLFIDPKNGKVTLIDNDMGFYPGQSHVRSPSRNPGLRRFSGSTAGLPSVIDAKVYKKLMSITSAQIHQQMDGLLTLQEIRATINRVSELQHHANQLFRNGRIIQNWQQWRDPATSLNPAQFQRHYAPDSYLLSVQGQSRGL